jgi:hypothetical protein
MCSPDDLRGAAYRRKLPAFALQAEERERRKQEQQRLRAQAELQMASERQKLEDAALPLMLDAMWAANVMDIQQTLKAVCHEVCTLHVPAMPTDMRLCCTRGTFVYF